MSEDLKDFLNFIKILGAVLVTVFLIVATIALSIGVAFRILEAL